MMFDSKEMAVGAGERGAKAHASGNLSGKIEYLVMLIAASASHYRMTDVGAYRYLSQHGAIKLAHEFYDVMHTQPFGDMVESMAAYCRRKGGAL